MEKKTLFGQSRDVLNLWVVKRVHNARVLRFTLILTRSPAQKSAFKDLSRNGQSPAITPEAAYTPTSTRAGSRSGGLVIMALASTGSAQGDPKTYRIGSNLKRFTLIDLGFVPTKNGNFQLQRSLDPNSPYTAANKLKMTVAKTLDKFQLDVTTGNGLKAINIFKNDSTKENVEQYEYWINNFIERGVLEPK